MIHGQDPTAPGVHGFYASRHAYGADEVEAKAKVLSSLTREFTKGASARLWGRGAPLLRVEESWRISFVDALRLANTGSTFYFDEEPASTIDGLG